MPRALLSVSDKTGLVEFAAALARPRLRAGLDRRHGPRARRRRPARDRRLGRHRLSRDAGRPREDAAPRRPRRHPRAPRRDPDDLAALARHGIRLDRPRGREPLPVRRARPPIPATPFDAPRRGDRHRRAEPRARRREELPRRARRRVAGRLRAPCSPQLDRPDGPSLAFRFELARKAFAHTAAYDAAIAAELDARRGRGRAAFRADGARTQRCPARLRPRPRQGSATCATARTRTSAAAWYRAADERRRARRRPAGQGAVVHEPARPRRGRAHRGRVRRAGGRRHQAHEPVRRRDRRVARRRLRPGARRRRARRRSAASSG